MAKDQFYTLLEGYLNEDLDDSARQALEQALHEDEDLQKELDLLLAERKAYQGLDDYLDEGSFADLKSKTWLSSLYASVIMIGSFSARAKQFNQAGKRKSDQGSWAVPGDSE